MLMLKKFDSKIKYTKSELLYLRLYAYGWSSCKIKSFLQLNLIEFIELRESIMKKDQSKNWVKIIIMAFKKGFLKKSDFISPEIRRVCEKHADLIFKFVVSDSNQDKKKLENHLGFFLHECDWTLFNYYQGLPDQLKLTENEITNIFDTYNLYSNLELIFLKEQGFLPGPFVSYLNNLTEKLQRYNWFGIFKLVFEYRILELPKINYQSFQRSESMAILELVRIEDKNDFKNSVKLESQIYNRLLELYARIEFIRLENANLYY